MGLLPLFLPCRPGLAYRPGERTVTSYLRIGSASLSCSHPGVNDGSLLPLAKPPWPWPCAPGPLLYPNAPLLRRCLLLPAGAIRCRLSVSRPPTPPRAYLRRNGQLRVTFNASSLPTFTLHALRLPTLKIPHLTGAGELLRKFWSPNLTRPPLACLR